MNMHGIIEPRVEDRALAREPRLVRMRGLLRRRRNFLLAVVLPVLLVAGYLYLIASDQYESEAHFLIRTADATPLPGTGVSQMLSMATGMTAGQGEAISVADYLTSHDVVETLRRRDHLVQRYNRPDADILSRLRFSDPTPETLLHYYRGKVKVDYNTETGITTLRVHSFRPNDSFEIARDLMALGEARVNALNQRSYEDAIATSRREVAAAENDLAANQGQLTHFRQSRADIDPQASGQAQLGVVSSLTGQLAAARAQLNAMGGLINRSSPQYQAVAARVQALQAQVAAQSGRLAGPSGAIATDIGGYEQLRLKQDFLAKRYEAAATSLEHAREQALKQQLYVVPVVDPNIPVKALFPERFRILATVTVALLLAYSIGWLIAAGVREHAA